MSYNNRRLDQASSPSDSQNQLSSYKYQGALQNLKTDLADEAKESASTAAREGYSYGDRKYTRSYTSYGGYSYGYRSYTYSTGSASLGSALVAAILGALLTTLF